MRGRVAWLLVLVAGCGRGSDDVRRFTSNTGTFTVEMRFLPTPVPLNEPFTVDFNMTAKPADRSTMTVEVDARMPAHFHGMTRVPKVTRQADGSWRAEGMRFHMPGRWEIHVDVTRNGVTERAQTDVILK